MTMVEPTDMDAVLDAALDELDDDSSSDGSNDNDNDHELDENASRLDETKQLNEPAQSTRPHTSTDQSRGDLISEVLGENRISPKHNLDTDSSIFSNETKWFQSALREYIEGDDGNCDPDAFLGKFMDQVQSRLPSPGLAKGDPSSPESRSKQKTNASVDGSVVDETISSLLEGISKVNMESNAPPDDDLLKGMFEGFDPSSFNADAMLDGMVEQLLSKDLMYEPMKQVTELFPNWLEDNRLKLSPEEYEQRCTQCECFQKLVKVYETSPDNVTELLELMQQVQEYGQPPQDIINKIAPGLELDENGMPKMNMGNMPFGENEECSVM